MGFPLPPLPWYTWLALIILGLLGGGMIGAMFTLVSVGIRSLLIAAWIGIKVLAIKLFDWRLSSFGTAHWAGRREIRRAGLFTEAGIALGSWKGRTLVEPKGGHIVLFGPPRSRKSWGLIMPAIIGYHGSVVVADLRGELCEQTREARERLGPVYRFDPAGQVSDSLNLLDMIRWGTMYEFGDVHRIAHHVLAPTRHDATDTFRQSAIPLLMAIMLHQHLSGTGSFPGVVEWMTSPDRSLNEKLAELLASPHALVQAGARRTLDQSDRLRMVVWNAVLQPLVIFQDPLIASHSLKSDCDLGDLLDGVQPVSLFLCMSFGDIPRLGVLLGTLVEILVNRLGTPLSPPRHKVLLCLDECANLGRLSDLEHAVSYLSGSGTQALLVFQNMAQVLQTYGDTSPLLASIGCQVHYAPQDALTASAITGHLGESTVTSVTTTRSGESSGRSISEHQRPLLTPDEVLRLPANDAILLVAGAPPIRAQKLGAVLPTTSTAVLAATLYPYRWPGLAVGVAALFLLALAPLWHAPTSQPGAPTPTLFQNGMPAAHQQRSPVPMPTLSEYMQTLPSRESWVLVARQAKSESDVNAFEVAFGRYATQEACLNASSKLKPPLAYKASTFRCVEH